MKKAILVCSVGLFLNGLSPITTSAEENALTVVVGGAINYKKLEFAIGNSTFNPNLTTFDLSLTGAYKGVYASINYDESIKDAYIYDYSSSGQDDTIMIMSRRDSGFTLGYAFSNSLSLFGGYLDGATEVWRPANYTAIVNSEPDRFNIRAEINMKGPFAGIGYSLPVGERSSLSANIAYADMEGDFIFDEGATQGKISGDTTGFSYGINLTGPVVESMVYRVGFKVNRYKFEDTDYDASTGGDDFTHDQNYTIFYVGLSNYF
ncbi:MAG: hypothetical protein OEZ10_00905 [Gammaproteobacteria bacterium]|nr:hypothetical protein [Gammaproteobacteria bacterium]